MARLRLCDVEVANSGHVLQAHWSDVLLRLDTAMQYCTLRRHRFEPRVSVVLTSAYNMCVSMNEAAAMMPPSLGQILNLVTYRGCTLHVKDILNRPVWESVTHARLAPSTRKQNNQILHNSIRRPESTPRNLCSRMLYTNSSRTEVQQRTPGDQSGPK